MRLSELKPRELYATKATTRSANRRSTGPALLLDTRFWNLTPGPEGPSFSLAQGEEISGSRGRTLVGTGARMGLLVVQASPLAVFTEGFDEQATAEELDAIRQREGIEKLSQLVRRDAIDRTVGGLKQDLPPSLILNVVTLQGLVSPWQAVKKYRCPGDGCTAKVDLDSANRVRPHDNDKGVRCAASMLYMPVKVQKANLITT